MEANLCSPVSYTSSSHTENCNNFMFNVYSYDTLFNFRHTTSRTSRVKAFVQLQNDCILVLLKLPTVLCANDSGARRDVWLSFPAKDFDSKFGQLDKTINLSSDTDASILQFH
ncbi:Uncharacterized protein Fot_22324 [Forsythia ovata]|uniref:Uncharacterized protein n=1 Tax=Forsythia ovata TaxID=205694 RepID=A0ABD1UXE4_9LAMI